MSNAACLIVNQPLSDDDACLWPTRRLPHQFQNSVETLDEEALQLFGNRIADCLAAELSIRRR